MHTCMCNWVAMLYSRKLTEHCKPAIKEKIKSIIYVKKGFSISLLPLLSYKLSIQSIPSVNYNNEFFFFFQQYIQPSFCDRKKHHSGAQREKPIMGRKAMQLDTNSTAPV